MPHTGDTNRTVLTMSHKERERLAVLSRLVKRELTCVEAAESLGLTRRQIYRNCDRYIDEGDERLIHRLRGATSNFGYGFKARKLALDLFRERYSDYGPTLFAEMLEAHHAEVFPQVPDSETLRRWLSDDSLHIFFNNQELEYSFVKVKPKRPPSVGIQQPVDHPWRLCPAIGKARYRNNNPSRTRRLNPGKKLYLPLTPNSDTSTEL